MLMLANFYINSTPLLDRIAPEIWVQIFEFVTASEPSDVLELDRMREDIESDPMFHSFATKGDDTSTISYPTESDTNHAIKYKRPDTLRARRYLPATAVISHVCGRWRGIALSCCALWGTIKFLHRGLWPYNFIVRSQHRNTRARTGGELDVYLDLSQLGKLDETLTILFDSTTRIASLSVAASVDDIDKGERDPNVIMKKVLGRLGACEVPILRSVTLTLIDDGYDDATSDESMVGDEGEETGDDSGREEDEEHGDIDGGGVAEAVDDQLADEMESWDDVDGGDDDNDSDSGWREVKPWEAVAPIEIPSSIFNHTPPHRLIELSVTAPLYISPRTAAFANIRNLMLFDIKEKAFWNVVNDMPSLEGLFVEFHHHFHIPTASPLSAESLVKDRVFLPHLQDLRVVNARVPTFRRFFFNVLPVRYGPMRRFLFRISARHRMGPLDGQRLSSILEPMHRMTPIDVASITFDDWESQVRVLAGPSANLNGRRWQNPETLDRTLWPFRLDLITARAPKPDTSWLHFIWPDTMPSPSHFILTLSGASFTRRGRFLPAQWVDLARRFSGVEHLKVDDPFVFILMTLWPESPSPENVIFPKLKTLVIAAEEVDRTWVGYQPPSERIGLIRQALRAMGSSRTNRTLERLVFMGCDPAFSKDELDTMKELVGAVTVEFM